MKIDIWDEAKAQREFIRRFDAAKKARIRYENDWRANENLVYANMDVSLLGGGNFVQGSKGVTSMLTPDIDDGDNSVNTNRLLRNFRFLHSQMAANPPTVLPQPLTPDIEDRRRASSADYVVRYNIRQYSLLDFHSKCNLSVLLYGTGITKEVYNPFLGEVLEYDPETNDVTMEGDFDLSVPSVWDIWFDPDTDDRKKIKWTIERKYIPWEDALQIAPDKRDILEEARTEDTSVTSAGPAAKSFDANHYDVVVLYEMYEVGAAVNGLVGRWGLFTEDGQPIKIGPNPHRFRNNPNGPMIEIAQLPYQILTDIDIPNTVWGASVITYARPLQEALNQLTNMHLDALNAHAVPRLILNDSAKIADDSITTSPYDVIRVTGNSAFQPNFVEAMTWPESCNTRMAELQMQIDEIMGVNENMLGQQSREQSGFSMQYATNQGNMVRRRLFDKYVEQVESVHKSLLNMARKHWSDGKVLKVVGNENAFEVYDFKVTDITGGYDLLVQYGASFSLDPTTRREEIMALLPLFEKAGQPPRQLLSHLKMNELNNMFDGVQLAERRQQEYFDEIITLKTYVPPEELEEHQYMLQFAYRYVMTAQFKRTPPELRELIKRHVKEREMLVAQAASSAAQGAGGTIPPGPTPQPQLPGQALPDAAGSGQGVLPIQQ